MIPFNRPSIGDAEYTSVLNVMNSGWLTEGPVTQEFERRLMQYLGAPTCVVNNGSSALMCSLLAMGIKPGDLVVVPAITYVATAMVPLMLGARVRLVDVDPYTFNIDRDKLFDICEHHEVDFVIPVHIGGRQVSIDDLHWLASLNHNVPEVVFDAAQAFGSKRMFGVAPSCYSFQMTKTLTTVEGGCIVSQDRELIDRCRSIKNYGRTDQLYVHDMIGSNFRTTDLQSAIGIEQLKQIDKFVARRKEVYSRYRSELKNCEFQATNSDMVPMFCFVRVENKSVVIDELNKVGIDARSIWPPLDVQPCLTSRLLNGGGPNADYIYEHTLSLPLSNGITDDEVDTIIKEFNKLVN